MAWAAQGAAFDGGEGGYPEMDPEEASWWLYPSNYGEVRKYQRDITETALFNNTLVCLPTGLGKTLIASVVMQKVQPS